jgi:hypothetical protein
LQLWCHAAALVAEVILDGISRAKGRCSAIGRNAMSADLQASASASAIPCISLYVMMVSICCYNIMKSAVTLLSHWGLRG